MNQTTALVQQGPTLGSGPRNFEWYQALNKPRVNPPQWVFPVVWTILYIMIIASFFIYLKDTDFQYTMALIFFSIQMVLNIIWTPIFFWKKMITWALVDIILLWVFILVTIIQFHERSPVASYLLIPYNVWVTLATYLNAYIVFNNPDPSRTNSDEIKKI